jgi:putative oxidoreductase
MGSADQDEEERKLAAERNALREARAAALTTAGVPEPVGEAPAAVVEQVVEVKRTTDGFWGSLGLFLLRLVLAGTFGVWGVQMLLDPAKTQSLFATTVLSYPILATIVPVASLLISVSMVIGLATRYAAFGAALISIGALALVYWGSWSILVPNGFGFYGESELLIAAASLLIVFVGAGGWSLDGSLRRARAADKAARAS